MHISLYDHNMEQFQLMVKSITATTAYGTLDVNYE